MLLVWIVGLTAALALATMRGRREPAWWGVLAVLAVWAAVVWYRGDAVVWSPPSSLTWGE